MTGKLWATGLNLAIAAAGSGRDATLTSVLDVVAMRPELSLLQDNIDISRGLPITDKLKDPSFIGTFFAATNAVSRSWVCQ